MMGKGVVDVVVQGVVSSIAACSALGQDWVVLAVQTQGVARGQTSFGYDRGGTQTVGSLTFLPCNRVEESDASGYWFVTN